VQRPAEIVNYRSMGTTTHAPGAALAVAAMAALGLTADRLGPASAAMTWRCSKRSASPAVSWPQSFAWQATVAVVIGIVVGVPLGVILGRQLWILFANQIHVVPQPTVPVASVMFIALGALLFANLVAASPAGSRRAPRPPSCCGHGEPPTAVPRSGASSATPSPQVRSHAG